MDLPKKKGFHRHHIIPKHAGGTDEASNLVYLTPEEHALAHKELYEKHGDYRDALAHNQLIKWANGKSLKGYKQSPEHIAKRTAAVDQKAKGLKLKGRIPWNKDKSTGRPSDETIKKISEATKGRKKDNSKGLMGKHWVGKVSPQSKQLHCIGCRQPVSPSRQNRHGKCFK